MSSQAPPNPSGAHKYVLGAVDLRGRRVTEEVAAATPQDAVRELQSRGWTKVTLVTDNFQRIFVPPEPGEAGQDTLTATDQARLMYGNWIVQGLVVLKHVYAMFWKILLIPAAILVFRRVQSDPWSLVDLALSLTFALPPLLLVLFSGPVTTFRKIDIASVWSRWDEMLRLSDKLEQQLRKKARPASALAVALPRAKALMRLGRVDEALEVLDKLRLRGDVPELSILLITGLAYQGALRSDEAVKYYRRMTEIAPADSLGWVSLADAYANALEQPGPAREALSHVDRTGLAVESLRCIESAEAGIDLYEGRAAQAALGYERLIKWCRTRVSTTPSARIGVAWYQGLHAIACIRCGRTNDAVASYKAAVPWLERASSTRMLSRLNKAMGQFTPTA